MRNLLLLFTLLFMLNACGDTQKEAAKQAKLMLELHEIKTQKDALVEQLRIKEQALKEARAETKIIQDKLLAEKKDGFLKEKMYKEEIKRISTQQNTDKKPSLTGIKITKNKITIDTDKTKSFFQKLSKSFESKTTNIVKSFEKGIIDEKEAGVHIDDTHINIDLNKTKDFLETWGKQLQSFVKELDTN